MDGGAILDTQFGFIAWYALSTTYFCVFFPCLWSRKRLELFLCSTEGFLFCPQGILPTPENQNYRVESSDWGGREKICNYTDANNWPSKGQWSILNSWKTYLNSLQDSRKLQNNENTSICKNNQKYKKNKYMCVLLHVVVQRSLCWRRSWLTPVFLSALVSVKSLQSRAGNQPPTVTQSSHSYMHSQTSRLHYLVAILVRS